MANANLEAGVLGWGFIGPAHRDALNLLGNLVRPIAVAESNTAKHGEIVKQGLRVYMKAEEIINNPEIQGVHIAGPDEFHAQWAISAMDAGKKVVVCEKPMTTTLEDSVRVLERAQKFEKEGGVFMVNFNYLGHAMTRAVRELHAKGSFGKEDYEVLGRYLQSWLMKNELMSDAEKIERGLADVWNWRLDGLTCSQKDILPHLMSATYFMTGLYPVELVALSGTHVNERVVEKGPGSSDAFSKTGAGSTSSTTVKEYELRKCESDTVTHVLCRFNNQAHGNYTTAQVLAGEDNNWSLEYYGSRRSAKWNQEFPNLLRIGQSFSMNRVPGDNELMDPGQVGDIILKNDPERLKAMGCYDAAQYSPYPGGHPAGHINAFSAQFGTAYNVATGRMKREDAVIPGAVIGHMCVAVNDAVLRSRQSHGFVNVDYKGIEDLLKRGVL